jgi:FliI/YscN family ATPase
VVVSALAAVGTALLGRAIAADGSLLAGDPPGALRRALVDAPAPPPHERRPVTSPFWTGVHAIDGPLTVGRGARIGIFGAPGAGKSTLVETLVRGSAADAVVVALVGERGREAERWLRELDRRTTIVCATADRAPAERVRAAELAMTQAEALRERGLDVLLVLDSLARYAAAARDLAVAAGEPLGRGGVPASVTGRQARLLERAGPTRCGSITAIATVLSEGPLEHDPTADAARAALDGHLILAPRLAAAGWFPAIDLPASASRTAPDVTDPGHRAAAGRLRAAVAALEASRDVRALGLVPERPDPVLARAIAAESEIAAFLRQDGVPAAPAETTARLGALAALL